MTTFKRFMIIVSLLPVSYAQAITISGVVKDKQTSLPVSGAKVTLLKEGLSGTTDSAGKYSLSSNTSASDFSDTLIVTDKKYWEKISETKVLERLQESFNRVTPAIQEMIQGKQVLTPAAAYRVRTDADSLSEN